MGAQAARISRQPFESSLVGKVGWDRDSTRTLNKKTLLAPVDDPATEIYFLESLIKEVVTQKQAFSAIAAALWDASPISRLRHLVKASRLAPDLPDP